MERTSQTHSQISPVSPKQIRENRTIFRKRNNRSKIARSDQQWATSFPSATGWVAKESGRVTSLIPRATIGAVESRVRHNNPAAMPKLSDRSTWQDQRANDRFLHFM
ncbi:MAG: hypothetical protein CMM05_06110 [Rhodopirellula sp.]|nr:hypothetical protein [Rhodopirellula sp.]